MSRRLARRWGRRKYFDELGETKFFEDQRTMGHWQLADGKYLHDHDG